jgi:hypothetical protein
VPASASSRKIAGTHGLAQLLHGQKPRRQRLPIGKLGGAIAALGVEKVEQADGAALAGVFADVAVFLRPIEIPGAVISRARLGWRVVRAASSF